MKSSFSVRVAGPIILLAVCSCTIIAMLWFIPSPIGSVALLLLGFVTLVWCWIMFGEMRLRVITLELFTDHLSFRPYFGLGPARVFYYRELDGYETRILAAEHHEYEYLFIRKNGKRVIRLSEFYHDNYAALKWQIRRKLKGQEQLPYSWSVEIKDIFGSRQR